MGIAKPGLACLSKRIAFAALIAFATLAASPARADDEFKDLHDAALKEPEMTWYVSLYGQDVAQQVVDAFAKKYPDLKKVVAIRRTTGATFQRIDQELRAKATIASVLTMSAVSDYYAILKQAGNLAQYTPRSAAKLDPTVQNTIDPGYAYPVGGGLMAIAYNPKLVPAADAPKSWDDLLDPKWKGKLALSHPAFSGFDAALDVYLMRTKGWDYFVKIAKNDPLIQRSTFDTVTGVSSGESAVTSLPDSLAIDSTAKGNPLIPVYPTDGSVLIVGLTAIMKDAPQPATAKLFTEFLLGVEHSQVEVNNHYFSARPEVPNKLPDGRDVSTVKVVSMEPSEAFGKDLTTVMERWRELFGG